MHDRSVILWPATVTDRHVRAADAQSQPHSGDVSTASLHCLWFHLAVLQAGECHPVVWVSRLRLGTGQYLVPGHTVGKWQSRG